MKKQIKHIWKAYDWNGVPKVTWPFVLVLFLWECIAHIVFNIHNYDGLVEQRDSCYWCGKQRK